MTSGPDAAEDMPVALVTGVGRAIGIGAAVAKALADDGWRVVAVGWRAYDERMPWGADAELIANVEADLADPEVPGRLFDDVNSSTGMVSALVCCHAESVDSSIRDTTVESFDRHMIVNARATWLLIKAFAEQFTGPFGSGRIIALTSDHTPFNLPYGASKGALDRIVLAAAVELADLGVTANVINPGATDTGWMDDDLKSMIAERNLQERVGRPDDCARLVRFLCSPDGQWINGQLIHSDGGR
ncbi:MAG TPA: SDR family oxidoreductase [Ilumatobacteraceae bacterium]